MALGEIESAYLRNTEALQAKMVAEAENYLKKSDSSTRPIELVNMATETINSGAYNASRTASLLEVLSNPKKNSADKLNDRLRADYGY